MIGEHLARRANGTIAAVLLLFVGLVSAQNQEPSPVMIDWAHGNVITAEGHYDEGKLIFNTLHMGKGKLLIDRITIDAVGADRVEWTVKTSLDGGKTWVTFWTLRYSRQ